MRFSSFLTFIVFCFLLFMEAEDEQEEAGMHLFAQLGALRDLLKKLQRDTDKRTVSNDNAHSRIQTLMDKVDEDTTKLAGLGGKIRKDIDFGKSVDRVYVFIKSIDYSSKSSENLDEKLGNIEGIWNNIQNEVNKVI